MVRTIFWALEHVRVSTCKRALRKISARVEILGIDFRTTPWIVDVDGFFLNVARRSN